MTQSVLELLDLSVTYQTGAGPMMAMKKVSLSIAPGETLGIVGESGSGKSTAALAVIGIVPGGAKIQTGQVIFEGEDVYALSPEKRDAIRGRRASMVFQDPFTSLNPSLTIGYQVSEPLMLHRNFSKEDAQAEVIRLLNEVGISNASDLISAYPHQLSGGMKQRALIATALACDPNLLILDEPTTALDVTVEAQILDLLEQLQRTRNLSMMFISHNLGVIARLSDRICVMYAGQIVEVGSKDEVLYNSAHPYTKGLLASAPRIGDRKAHLSSISGRLPNLGQSQPGCIFMERCPFSQIACKTQTQNLQSVDGKSHESKCWRTQELRTEPWPEPEAIPSNESVKTGGSREVLVAASNLTKVFSMGGGLGSLKLDFNTPPFFKMPKTEIHAVDGIDIEIAIGETVGLVGESGSGKSTLGRCLIRLLDPSSGTVEIDGRDIFAQGGEKSNQLQKVAQIVFQNPDSSLNPRKTVREILARPLKLFNITERQNINKRVDELLEMVHLSVYFGDRYPHQMSGGEKQRVGIARALAMEPKFVVCDEAVSALDVSVQASVLNLLSELKGRLGIAFLFITHDLSVVSHIADRVCVMYRGRIVEEATLNEILAPPYHPYTEVLLSSIPMLDQSRQQQIQRDRIQIKAHTNDAAGARQGCPFRSRCPANLGAICENVKPPVHRISGSHSLSCHLSSGILRDQAPLLQTSVLTP